MVFNETFNNILIISWQLVSLMEQSGENKRPVTSNCQTLTHHFVSSTPHHERDSNSQF